MSDKNIMNAKVLDDLFDSISQIPQTDEELNQTLQSAGIDPEALVIKGLENIGRVKAQHRLSLARKQKNVLQEARTRLLDYAQKVDKPIQELVKLFSDSSQLQTQGFFSKLESLNDDEAMAMLDELTLLDLIEQIEKEEKP